MVVSLPRYIHRSLLALTVPTAADILASARRVVVKVGSALLIDSDSGAVDRAWLSALADDLARLRARGQQVIAVSSGAVALGRPRRGPRPPGRRGG